MDATKRDNNNNNKIFRKNFSNIICTEILFFAHLFKMKITLSLVRKKHNR